LREYLLDVFVLITTPSEINKHFMPGDHVFMAARDRSTQTDVTCCI